MTLEFAAHFPEEPDFEPLQGRELFKAIAKKIAEYLRSIGFEEADLKRFGDKVGIDLPFQHFSVAMDIFIEKNLEASDWRETAFTSFIQEYPLGKEAIRILGSLKTVLTREEIHRLTEFSLNAWLRDGTGNPMLRDLREQAAPEVYQFASLFFEKLDKTSWDKGYSDVEEAGVVRPSVVGTRTSFLDIFSQPPEGIQIDDRRFLAFFIPEETGQVDRFAEFCEDQSLSEQDEFEATTLSEDAEQSLIELESPIVLDDDEMGESNDESPNISVGDIKNYFIVLDKKVTKELMKALITNKEFRPILRCIFAYYIVSEQFNFFEMLKEFFYRIAVLKRSEILDHFDRANEDLNQQMWQLLETSLRCGRVVIEQMKRVNLPSRESDWDSKKKVSFSFQKLENDSIRVTVQKDGINLGEYTLKKDPNAPSYAWKFEDGETIVGYDLNSEIPAGVLTEGELLLNEFFGQITIPTPPTLSQYHFRLEELTHLMATLDECTHLSDVLKAMNLGPLSEVSTRVKPFLEFGEITVEVQGFPFSPRNPDNN